MLCLPPQAHILNSFAPAFTAPTFQRFLLLSVGAIVCFGRRTVSRILWSVRDLLAGHPSSYHRVFSRRSWSLWPMGKILASAVLELLPADQPVRIELDDTTEGPHRGNKVYGKGCWRDAVRSSVGHLATLWGLRWVVLAVNVQFAFCSRPWALPILVALVRKEQLDRQEKHRPKSAGDLGRGLLAVLIHWFPQRRFVCTGDWGFGSHDLALFAHRHRRHLTLVARSRGDNNLYALPHPPKHPPRPRNPKLGPRQRPPCTCRKGRKLPKPQQSVASTSMRWSRNLRWYGNSTRTLQLLSGCGGWYRARGHGRAALVPIRWVHTHDPQTNRDDYFFSTDPRQSPQSIVEDFAGRWPIEVSFEEVRSCLGLHSTRNWKRESILRITPCLFALFSVVSLIYAGLVGQDKPKGRRMPCYVKREPTFSDALFAVRKLLWREVILQQGPWQPYVTALPPPVQATLLAYLAEAA